MTGAEPVPNPLTAFYAPVRREIVRLAAGTWPGLEAEVASHLTGCRLPTSVALPLGACAAAGGDPRHAVSTAACFGLLHLAVRWLDDLADRDRQDGLWRRIGPARATNFAAAALTLAWQALVDDPDLPRAVHAELARACVATARGQDIDLRGGDPSIETYWDLVDGKTGAGLAFAARAGGLIAGAPAPRIAALGEFAIHAGRLVQILDDLEGVFCAQGLSDLAAGKITLPLIYGLRHPAVRDELAPIVASGRLAAEEDRVRAVLDAIGVRDYVLWAAIEHRDLAIARLCDATDPRGAYGEAGRDMLTALVNLMFCDLATLAGEVD